MPGVQRIVSSPPEPIAASTDWKGTSHSAFRFGSKLTQEDCCRKIASLTISAVVKHFKGGEQTGGAVAQVVVGAAFGLSGAHGEQGRGLLESLNLALLVDCLLVRNGTSAQSPFTDEGNPAWHQLGSRRENFADTQVVSVVGWRYILDRDRKAAGGIQDRLHLHPVGVAGT